jgi:hypothetical protein
MSWELDNISNGVKGLIALFEFIERLTSRKRRAYDSAIRSIYEATSQTRHYLARQREGGPPDRKREMDLSQLWFEAYAKLSRIDPDLAERCLIKSDCWSDPRLFSGERYAHVPLDLDTIFDKTRTLLHA